LALHVKSTTLSLDLPAECGLKNADHKFPGKYFKENKELRRYEGKTFGRSDFVAGGLFPT
jgi:hypothetical protein